MKNFKVVGKTIFVNILVPVEIGQIKLDAVYQVSLYQSKKEGEILYDIDDIDYQNITYMGMEVDGYNGYSKLKEFHKELGIDLNDIINKEASSKFSPEDLEKWVNKTYKNTFSEVEER